MRTSTLIYGNFYPRGTVPRLGYPQCLKGLHAQDAKAHSVLSIALAGGNDAEFASAHSVQVWNQCASRYVRAVWERSPR